MEAAERGDKRHFDNRQVDPRYHFTNTTLIEKLCITPSEMAAMTSIITRKEKRRRNAERKRAQRQEKGCLSRAAYVERAENRALQARALRAAGATLVEIAAALGVSRSTASGYCRSK